MDPDLTLDPDDYSLDNDTMDNIDDDDAYYDDDDLANDSDYLNDDDDDEDEVAERPVRDATTGKMEKFGKWLKDMVNPIKRAKAKFIKAKAKHIKTQDKLAKFKLKSAAKKVGLLSMAALAFKMMLDHHQDKLNKEDIDEINKMYADSKKAKSSTSKKSQDPMLLSIGHLTPDEMNNGLTQAQNALGTAKTLTSQIGSLNAQQTHQAATLFGKSYLNNLASSFGINTTKFGQAFNNLIHMF